MGGWSVSPLCPSIGRCYATHSLVRHTTTRSGGFADFFCVSVASGCVAVKLLPTGIYRYAHENSFQGIPQGWKVLRLVVRVWSDFVVLCWLWRCLLCGRVGFRACPCSVARLPIILRPSRSGFACRVYDTYTFGARGFWNAEHDSPPPRYSMALSPPPPP